MPDDFDDWDYDIEEWFEDGYLEGSPEPHKTYHAFLKQYPNGILDDWVAYRNRYWDECDWDDFYAMMDGQITESEWWQMENCVDFL